MNEYVRCLSSFDYDWVTFESESGLCYFFKVQEIDLCEMFCDINFDQYDKAIGEFLAKLAFKAVEIINVSI